MHLTLLIPELVWSNPDDRLIYDALDASPLASLLARGRLDVAPKLAAEEWLAARFGLPTPAPIAALRLLGDGIAPGDAQWICADPVHLRFHQERLVLADDTQVGISAEEASRLIASLNENFADVGEFVAADPKRWALRLQAPVSQAWPPLSQAVGREVRLDALLGDRDLKRLGHETQMLLHAHPVNAAREATGRTPVNALWFWGAGRLDQSQAAAAKAVPTLFATSALARGLARHTGAPLAPAPATLAELLAARPAGGTLVELDQLLAAANYENGADYLDALQSLDRDWFAGLAAALRSGRLSGLELVVPSGFGLLHWHIGRLNAWTPWGGSTKLSATIRRLAEKDSA